MTGDTFLSPGGWRTLDHQENSIRRCMPLNAFVLAVLAAQLLALPFACAQQPAPDAAAKELRPRPLHQVRVPHPHARRQAAVHRGLCAQGTALPTTGPVSVPDGPHALQRRPLRRRPVSRAPRPLGRVRKVRLHLCLPGRARTLDERGRVRRDASAHRREKVARRRGRLLRHLRHHRVSAQARAPTTTARWASGASPIRGSTLRRRSSTRIRRWPPPARRRP